MAIAPESGGNAAEEERGVADVEGPSAGSAGDGATVLGAASGAARSAAGLAGGAAPGGRARDVAAAGGEAGTGRVMTLASGARDARGRFLRTRPVHSMEMTREAWLLALAARLRPALEMA